MSTTSWRIVKRKYAGKAFDGEGARLYGGRWNSPGLSAVYTSGSISLALVEMLVHAVYPIIANYCVIPVTFDEAIVPVVDPATLPSDWRRFPAPAALAAIGDAWLRGRATAVLHVPSVIVPEESNYILNPACRGFAALEIGPPRDIAIDHRLAR